MGASRANQARLMAAGEKIDRVALSCAEASLS